ncbi:MAG: antitermination protein NusG [Acidobacteria bacterium]|jgi:transcription elongation factor/antiterminator RfaH|nr:MAG: antitermination protein NusG [Acidobacteriota bacterium]
MPWYAIYTRPRHEKQVYEDLKNRNIEAFLPIYKVRRRWSDRYKIIEEPLFKNYLFVNVEYERRYHDTLRPYGAVAFVTFDGKPAQIPEPEIEAIRRLVTSELPYNPHPYLKIGRRVRVRSGPLEDCEGILIRKKGLTRLVLSIHLLQQSVSAEVDADSVEPA